MIKPSEWHKWNKFPNISICQSSMKTCNKNIFNHTTCKAEISKQCVEITYEMSYYMKKDNYFVMINTTVQVMTDL